MDKDLPDPKKKEEEKKNTHQFKSKLKFPLTFPKCRVCGSTRLLVDVALKEEQPLVKDKTALKVHNVALVDQAGLLARPIVPILAALVDGCAECGTLRFTEVSKKVGATQQLGATQQPPPGWGIG